MTIKRNDSFPFTKSTKKKVVNRKIGMKVEMTHDFLREKKYKTLREGLREKIKKNFRDDMKMN